MKNVMGGMLASVLAIYMVGCAVDEPKNAPGNDTAAATEWQLDGSATNAGDPAKPQLSTAEDVAALQGAPPPPVTLSFFASCINPSASGVGNIATHAQADACRRFDGSFGGFTSWNGSCSGDVSNCNGRIVCQNHCP